MPEYILHTLEKPLNTYTIMVLWSSCGPTQSFYFYEEHVQYDQVMMKYFGHNMHNIRINEILFHFSI